MKTIAKKDVYELSYSETIDAVYIESIYVFKEHRNKGIGTMLIEKLCEKAKADGKKCVMLTPSNSKNKRLYKRLGFVHFKDGIMIKELV